MSDPLGTGIGTGTAAEAPVAADPRPAALLSARGIRKAYTIGDRTLEILHGVDLDVAPGELVALVGASGAGKSTLLHVLGLLDRPDASTVRLDGQDAWSASNVQRATLRNRRIGFVFQFYHLLPELSALENAILPGMISDGRLAYRRNKRRYIERADGMFERFGLLERRKHRPSQLSGGERQRVAIARDPDVLLADEPTGNLDSATGERVLELLFDEQRRRSLAMILVTHDESIARRCDRVLVMADGVVQREVR